MLLQREPSPGIFLSNFVMGNLSSKPTTSSTKSRSTLPGGRFRSANCPDDYGQQLDSIGNPVGGACGLNPDIAGIPTPDGKPDGFPDPRRHYQAFDLEANKSFSHNFMIRVNYRWAKLYGNYEGLYRNDNNQMDPSINSLFDFTNGVLGMLGDQYCRGYLNTDRQANRKSVRLLRDSLRLHEALYRWHRFAWQRRNPDQRTRCTSRLRPTRGMAIGGRGRSERTPSNYQLDLHADYPLQLGERYKVKFTFDTFNVTNSRR